MTEDKINRDMLTVIVSGEEAAVEVILEPWADSHEVGLGQEAVVEYSPCGDEFVQIVVAPRADGGINVKIWPQHRAQIEASVRPSGS